MFKTITLRNKISTKILIAIAIFASLALSTGNLLRAEDKDLKTESKNNENYINQVNTKAPCFKGGENEMVKFIQKNITYPEYTRSTNIQGTVIVTVKIDKSGKIIESSVNKSVHAALDNEALRVINKMPDWEPGTINGEPSELYVEIPISFRLK